MSQPCTLSVQKKSHCCKSCAVPLVHPRIIHTSSTAIFYSPTILFPAELARIPRACSISDGSGSWYNINRRRRGSEQRDRQNVQTCYEHALLKQGLRRQSAEISAINVESNHGVWTYGTKVGCKHMVLKSGIEHRVSKCGLQTKGVKTWALKKGFPNMGYEHIVLNHMLWTFRIESWAMSIWRAKGGYEHMVLNSGLWTYGFHT